MTTNEDANQEYALPAVERKDLYHLLDSHGLLSPFMTSELFCASCGKVLDDENIGALLVNKGLLIPYCNSPECIDIAMLEHEK